jgi:hypothetical protein
MNSIVGGIGQPNGIVQFKIDGIPVIDINNAVIRTGANSTLTFDKFLFAPYIGDGSPVDQTIWIDDLTVATAPPGTPLVGDLNSDGTVNALDWGIMNSQWFTSNAQSDINADGLVNSIDFGLMNSQWGASA